MAFRGEPKWTRQDKIGHKKLWRDKINQCNLQETGQLRRSCLGIGGQDRGGEGGAGGYYHPCTIMALRTGLEGPHIDREAGSNQG